MLNGPKADGETFVLNITFTDLEEKITFWS